MKSYNLITTIFAIFSALSCFAQNEPFENSTDSKIYIKVYGAYSLLTPGSFRGISNNDNNNVNIVKVQRIGMGGGLRAGGGIGMILNEFVNIGIDGEYLMGNKINVKVDALEGFSILNQSITKYEHQTVSIIPNIVFKAFSGPSYYIYNRVGLIVGIPLAVTESENYEYQFKDSRSDATADSGNLLQRDIQVRFNGEHKLKTSVGYQGALGVQMILGEKLRGFFEITVYGISFDRVKYEDIKRERIQTDLISRPGTPGMVKTNPSDNSRYIRYYAESGVTNFSSPPIKTGTENNYVYSSTLPQAPVNMNAITLGIGIAFRF